MPVYDGVIYTPPAPVAYVTLRDATGGSSITDVPMLIDTGADATLLPALRSRRWASRRSPSSRTS